MGWTEDEFGTIPYGNCYRAFNAGGGLDWTDAHADCVAQGGGLAVPTNTMQNAFVSVPPRHFCFFKMYIKSANIILS